LDDHVFVSLRRRALLLHDAETAFHDVERSKYSADLRAAVETAA
jgi:hypothetical protein